MPVIASLAALAIFAHERKLPHSTGVNARKSKASLTVDVDSLTALNAWADALEIGESTRNTYTYEDGTVVYTAWCGWNGWRLRVRYEQDPAPEPSSAEVDAAMLEALEVISRPRTAVMLP